GSSGNIFEEIAPEFTQTRSRAIAEIQCCRTRAIFIERFKDPNELFRVRERQRAQKHAFDDRKDCRICTDAERQREDSNQSEPGRLAQLAKSEFKVIHIIRSATPRLDRHVTRGERAISTRVMQPG